MEHKVGRRGGQWLDGRPGVSASYATARSRRNRNPIRVEPGPVGGARRCHPPRRGGSNGSLGLGHRPGREGRSNRTTTWRILATLEQQRLVARSRHRVVLPGLRPHRPRRAGHPRLADRLGRPGLAADRIRDRRDRGARGDARRGLAYVAEATAGAVVSAGWYGRQISMHATSTGKAFLAFSQPADLRMLLGLPRGGRLHRFTSSTITSLTTLRKGSPSPARRVWQSAGASSRSPPGGSGARARCRPPSRRNRQRVGTR